MKVKKSIAICALFLLILILTVSNAFASDYRLEVKPIYDTITPEEQATFQLVITNNEETDLRFRIYYSDVLWDFRTEPRTDSTVTIPAKHSKTISLVLKPNNLALATYLIPVTVNPEIDNEFMTVNLRVSIMSDEEKSGGIYGTAIETSVKMDDKVDPRKPLIINVEVANKNPKNNENMTFVLDAGLFTEQRSVSLGPYEKKQFTIEKTLNPLEKPDKYFLDAYFLSYQNNKSVIVGRIPRSLVFEIVEYGSFEKKVDVEKSFMSSMQTTTLSNTGNKEKTELIKIETSIFKMPFQKTSPKPGQMITEQEKRYYGFDVTLKPGETKQIDIINDYKVLFWILIVAIIAGVLYFIFRSPILVKKSYTHLTMKEGGISEMKVIIHIKNRSYKSRENIIVTDRVSNIAEVLKDFPVGTLQPSSILKHDKHGVVIKWEIDSLDGFEERILTYNIKSRLSILGEFRLSRAKATFTQFRRKRTTSSNRVVSRG